MMLSGGIRKQLQWLGLVPSLIMLLSLLLALTWQRFEDAEQELDTRGNFVARYVAAAAEYGMLAGNISELEQQARFALQNPDVREVAFIDISGEELVRVGAPEASLSPKGRHYVASIYRQPIQIGVSFNSVMPASAPQRVGEVQLLLSDAIIAQRQRKILLASVAPAVLALLLGLWIMRRMAVRISGPIQTLSALVQRIRAGEFQVRGKLPLDGELANLQSDINQLVTELERSQREQQQAMDALREARARAEGASQAKSDFLAMMSHELRTPMNGVLGMLQLLHTTNLNPRQDEYARAAVDSTTHLLDVINDILDFSRVESGRLETESVYFSLAEVLENCVSNFRFMAEQKGLLLECTNLDKLYELEVCSDPTRLRQIFSNLIGNALKFTERGHVGIDVDVSERSDGRARVLVTVADTGIGIAQEKLPRLFDAFTQVDSSTSRRFGGTGLGLAIVSRLMRLLGGELRAESEPGKGSTFFCQFDFPVRSLSEHAQRAQRDIAGDANLLGRVLLVEDNDVNRMVAEHMLSAMGLEVVCAGNGREALSLMDGQKFDCVLMDVQMPIMDGLTAVMQWREQERKLSRPRLPVIALTANALGGERERCLEAGMDDYLAKPFQRQSLLKLVSRYLSSEQ